MSSRYRRARHAHRDPAPPLPARPGPAELPVGVRPAVMRRDGGRCQWRRPGGVVCLARASAVRPIGDQSDHALANWRAVCADHDLDVAARRAG